MRAAGPLPVAVPISAGDYLAHRRDLLQRRFGEIEAKAALNALDDIRIKGGDRKITPLKAITPEAAEDALIVAQWDDVLRLATSVRTGAVSASLMLKRLRAYLGQNGLALASREIGRIERTLHALDWLERPALRRQATAELNKGESHNALARAVCFLRLGRLHDRTAQAHRASGLALVTAAIIPWNTVCLGRALDVVSRGDDTMPDALLAHLAPLGWQHISVTEDYLWAADAGVGPNGFRPIRGSNAQSPLVAENCVTGR